MLQLIVSIALIGLFCWALTTVVPMPPRFSRVIEVLAIVIVVILVLQSFGLGYGFPRIGTR